MRFAPDSLGAIHDLVAGTATDGMAIAQAVAARTALLRGFGVGPGDRIVIAHGGSTHFFADLLGVWQAGACAACVNASLTPDELANVTRFVEAKLVLIGDNFKGGEPGARLVDTRSERAGDGDTGTAGTLDDPALILFTSGTTGDPKGVVHTFRSILARLALNRLHLPPSTLARTLCVLPTHFGHGLIGNCLTPWLDGHSLFLFPQAGVAGAAKLGEILEGNRITFMSSVPSFWKIALKAGKPPAVRSLKRVGIGSAPLAAELWSKVADWTGAASVSNMYGITETANWIGGASSIEDQPEDGLIGRLWGGSAAVLDEDGVLHREGEGELLVQTPSLMQGYFRRPDLTEPVLKGGWFHTGDIGRIDAHGTMRLVGRQKDEINRAGQKVNPAEIDLFLERHSSIAEACCFGLPDPVSGEIVAAAVRLVDGATEDARSLRAWAGERLRHELVPEKWFILPEIPKTDRGKVSRRIVMQACLDKSGNDRPAMNEPKPPAPGAANRPGQGQGNQNRPNPTNPVRPAGAQARPQTVAAGVGQLRQRQGQPGARPQQGQGQGQGQGNRPQGQNAGQQQPRPAAKRPPGPPIRLETENYIVRSIEHGDVNEDYRDWTHDQEIMAGVNSSPTEMTIEDMHKYVDRFDNRNSFHFGIFDKNAGNKMIGFFVIYRDRRHNLAQTNVVIGNKDYWGKAVVLETRSAVLDFLFDTIKVGKIWGNPMVRNIRSVFNYKAQGFVAEGVLRRHRIDPDGKRVDQVMFGLLPEDWAAQKKKLAETGKLKESKS